MCGICGIYHYNDGRPVSPDVVIAMRDVMAHRGPDDCGLDINGSTGLGHRRLSVIDIQTGHQPIYNEDGQTVIVFNGELYNYIELRDRYLKGHQFKTRSDTEVIVHLYEEFGIDCLRYLNGMFAFAIRDEKKGKLFIARDHFGIKPVYYFIDDYRFVFASEIKSILKAGIRPILNEEMVLEYLTFQYYLGEETLFKGISRLEPGCYLEIDQQGCRKHRYWEIDCQEDYDLTEKTCEEEIKRLLEDSVRIQLRSDVPLGCHLSGGVDTGVVAGLASRHDLDGPLKTFTAFFPKESGIYDDSAFAEITARHNRGELHKLALTDDDFINSLETIFYHLDEPCAGEGVVPQYYVSKIASENVKVVLGGQGADEMFGGYVRYFILYYSYLLDRLANGEKTDPDDLELVDLAGELSQLRHYQKLFYSTLSATAGLDLKDKYFFLIDRLRTPDKVLNRDFIRKAGGYDPKSRMASVFKCSNGRSIINQVLYYEMKVWLPALLNIEDKTSMKWSLESRVPILDHRLCELAFKIPPKVKFRRGHLKYIFKRSMQNVLPPEIYHRRDKIGFPVPLFMWKDKLKRYMGDLIESCEYAPHLFDKEFLKRFSGEAVEFDRLTWGLISILNWFKIFKPSV